MAKRLTSGLIAPNFELTDTQGRSIKLSDFLGKNNVVLVLNRGFV
jgi:peroxiredoxin